MFILAMTLYPEVQIKAQEEIDRVVGQDRLPDLSDRENLPYIEGVFMETLRWKPVVPLGESLLRTSEKNSMERYWCRHSIRNEI